MISSTSALPCYDLRIQEQVPRVKVNPPFAATRTFLSLALFVFSFGAAAQTLTISNGVHTYTALTNTTVTMIGRCELRITATTAPIPGCIIHLNSADTFFAMPNIKPSALVANYLSQVRVNGALAVADSNCRVVEYAMGAVVVPHAPSFQPLQVFSGPHFTGASSPLSQYVYHRGTDLGALNAHISSFKLKRGYMATLAQNENGSGVSRNYVAQDGDLEVSVLPDELDDNVRFVFITAWRWASKKGIAGNIESGLNVQWKYNWNNDQNSTRDVQYIPIRQNRWWPGLGSDWRARGSDHLLGYNEPDRPDQANMSVDDAISSWPDLLATGLRVGAPAVSDGGRGGWLYPFMDQADAADLRVDFVPIHYYQCHNPANPAGAATQMYNFLKATYDEVKRPLWVTEWNNGANWTGCGDPTFAQQQAAIAEIIEMLDETPFVERYALYNWVEDARRVKWDDGSLTAAGVTYRDNASPIAYLQALQSNGTRGFTQLRFEANTLDTSGHGNNGISAGSPAYTGGRSGQAIVFDGTNTVVTLPPDIARNSGFTFAAWVNWSGGGNWQRIFDFGNSTTHYMFLTPSSGSGTLRFAIKNGGSEQIVQTSALPIGSWQHVAIALSGNTARLYVNGVQAAVNTGMSITPASFSPRVNFLGKSHFIGDPLFNGLMDEVLVTDFAMPASQIARLQTNTPPQFTDSVFPRGSATEGLAYSNSIAGTATDADPGDTLTYSKAAGPAWLNVAANGALTGTPTSGDGGTNFFTVRATDAAGANAFALVTVSVTTLTSDGVWIADAHAVWSDTNRWRDNIVATGAGRTADFSAINITANRIVSLDTSRTLGALRFGDSSGAEGWIITGGAGGIGGVLRLDTASASQPGLFVTNTITISAPITGTNGFNKLGPGTLILRGNNSLSGIVNIDSGSASAADGITRAAHANALGNASTIRIRNNNSGSSTFQLDGSAGGINIPTRLAVASRNVATPTIQNLGGTNSLNGDVSLDVGGSLFNIQSDAGLLIFNGTNQYTGSLTGARNYAFSGAGSHLLNGPVLNSANGAPIGLTKSGAGTLTLAATNTYTNTTTVTGGRLLVNGAITASPVIITSGAGAGTLGGNGVIGGPVTVQSGATLAPGMSVGKLTVNNNVTLQPGSITRIELDKSTGTNDQLRVLGSLTYAGTLVVTNLDGTLWAGDSFRIFNAATTSGSFTATNLPPLPNGFHWQWTLPHGTLTITSTVALNPTNITANFSGNTLALSWPADHTGWRLQSNSVDIGDTNSWFTLPGSTTTNQISLPVNPGVDSVFFRLIFP
jgi:autotransporter-associated beta strand protein